MERITQRSKTGEAYIPECFSRCDGDGCSEKCNDCEVQSTLIETLAKYEDLEVTPEQLKELDNLYLAKCEEVNQLNAKLAEAEAYIRLAEKMNLCDLVAENQRLTNTLIFRNAELLECKEALKKWNNERMNYEEVKALIKQYKNKVNLKLYSNDYAKGYCMGVLNTLTADEVSEDEYNELSKFVDDVFDGKGE